MPSTDRSLTSTLPRDLIAGLVVFLVALPLCLGVALASNAPLLSGVLAGIVGGIVVGALSGSHTSVSGPAAGLAAVVAAQITAFNAFPTFLLAVVVAGVIQMGLGLAKAGGFAAFLPSSVIKGLLAAIGVLLILKQIPHLFGHDADPEGDMSFHQPDHANTFTELWNMAGHIHPGAAVIGLASIAILITWDRVKSLKELRIPAPLIVVVFGVALSQLFKTLDPTWAIASNHYVQVPVAGDFTGFLGFLQFPDFSQWMNPAVYTAAVTLAAVASLETLLNLEAVDQIDPKQRISPPNRELLAQGVGNVAVGLIGGIPITSVIVRSSVNVNAGAQTKFSAIFHGLLLLVSVIFLPSWLNTIPLASLAAILLVTGVKLASPKLVKQMWRGGFDQFLPFATTVVAIVLTDLLTGVMIGLGVAVAYILRSNLRRPVRRFAEKHLGGEVLHIELANQVSFLNRAALKKVLDEVPPGGHVLLDAQNTDYIEPDVVALFHDFKEQTAPARNVHLSLIGFRDRYRLPDCKQYVESSTEEIRAQSTPAQVLQVLRDGNERFRSGTRITRDLGREVRSVAGQQHPLAVVLSCIDSRAPTELIFDLGVGDALSIRVAGNIISREVLGSVEYACAVAGAKLVLVLGHTSCGAVTAAVESCCSDHQQAKIDGVEHISPILEAIQESIEPTACRGFERMSPPERLEVINAVSRRNVARSAEMIMTQSPTLNRLLQERRIAVVAAMYDVATGELELLPQPDLCAS